MVYSSANNYTDAIETGGLIVLAGLVPKFSTTARPPTQDVTVSTIAAIGATELTLTSAVGAFVPYGSLLWFSVGTNPARVFEVVVADDVFDVAATKIPIEPLRTGQEIPANTPAKLMRMHRMLGGSEANLQMTDDERVLKPFEAGMWDRAKKISLGANVSWSGYFPVGSLVHRDVIIPAATSAQNVYLHMIYDDKQTRRALAYIQGYTENNASPGVLECSWTFRITDEIQFTFPSNYQQLGRSATPT